MSVRMERVNSELRRQLMRIVQEDIDDPSLDFLSITRVETTSDLQECKVYFSILDEKEQKRVQDVLDKMTGFIRVQLGKRVRIKILPKLQFIFDDSIKYSVDIYQRIEEVKKEDEAKLQISPNSGRHKPDNKKR